MDDGSRNIEESLTMLDTLISQGVDTVIATPHFYANEESLDKFLQRRQNAYDSICTQTSVLLT
jgi:protein-tyrosine phosphatase